MDETGFRSFVSRKTLVAELVGVEIVYFYVTIGTGRKHSVSLHATVSGFDEEVSKLVNGKFPQ